MVKKLIVNADDFGLSKATTLGIIEAHVNGIVTSTTCMINMPDTNYALDLAKQYPSLKIGIHLVLTLGKPLSQATSFIDENGDFFRPEVYEDPTFNVDKHQLYQEWKAQIEKFIALTKHKPTHIDSHHHIHLLPQFQATAIKLAKEYDLPIRSREPLINNYPFVRCYDSFYNYNINLIELFKAIDSDDEYLEIMVHPGYIDKQLCRISSYNLQRMEELELLCCDPVKKLIKDQQIELISYDMLKAS